MTLGVLMFLTVAMSDKDYSFRFSGISKNPKNWERQVGLGAFVECINFCFWEKGPAS
ncbi:hypothetical protein SAMN04489723_11458 [Algoriphagus aquimarinus]|uniref:Uncharacterized protein n=1 Tax=Algoriphagus aquimarinus TaxID=237018 RepID=A0A1I1BPS5_9BACT|nr:hypothetical protein SAMN04489723_11458 [Algoriphagus aquimarinus]